MTRKMACQPTVLRITPPSAGETAGPMANMRPIRFMIRAERCPVNWSRTIAREIAIPAATPKAGLLESGRWEPVEVGTPQGSGISPILANVFLHYAVDLWVHGGDGGRQQDRSSSVGMRMTW